MITKNEAIKAAYTLLEFCLNSCAAQYGGCEGCPFYESVNDICVLNDGDSPCDWQLDANGIWEGKK